MISVSTTRTSLAITALALLAVAGCGGDPAQSPSLIDDVDQWADDDVWTATAGETAAVDGAYGDQTDKTVANVSASALAGVAPLSVRFSGLGSASPLGRITDYLWDFGDGGTGDAAELYHTFAKPGLYSVRLTVADDTGEEGTAEADIAVLPAFEIEHSPTADPLTFEFEAISLSGSSDTSIDFEYTWDFGDGNVWSGKEARHSYARHGTYTVTLSLAMAVMSIDCATPAKLSTASAANSILADAGADQTVFSGAVVTLDGSSSAGRPGSELTFEWRQTFGPSVELDDLHGVRPRFVAPQVTEPTELGFTLAVSDGPCVVHASVVVNVRPQDDPGPPNEPPVAHAGPDQTLRDDDNDGKAYVLLDGSASHDPDGRIVLYRWIDGANGAPDNILAEGPKPKANVPLPVGRHVVELTVIDDGVPAKYDVDEAIVTIEDYVNVPPVADAGPDQMLTDEDSNGVESVLLDGGGSRDPDGEIVHYRWTEGAAILAEGSRPTANVELAVGKHNITLTVTDDASGHDADAVIIQVNPVQTFVISGRVTEGGAPLSGVTISGLPGDPVTNGSGEYAAEVAYGFSGTAVPGKAGYAFAPVSRAYDNVAANQVGEDYAGTATASNPDSPLGINFMEPGYWMPEWAFVDVFRQSREWQARKDDQPWLGWTGEDVIYGDDGYPAALPAGCCVLTVMCVGLNGNYPGGDYALMFEGRGRIRLRADAAGEFTTSGASVTVSPSNTGIYLDIRETDPADPIRNIRLIMPGFEDVYETEPLHPTFLAMLRPFRLIRVMQWQRTNGGNTMVDWSDRARPTGKQDFRAKGVPYEWCVDLANALGVDLWVCIPHLASDDFVRQFATLAESRLRPELKVYLEYSNECWNWSGPYNPQATYCYNQGVALGYEPTAGGASQVKGYAHHSCRAWRIWDDVFGEAHLRADRTESRLVRVFAWQNTSSWYSDKHGLDLVPAALPGITTETVAEHADAYSVGPYFGSRGGQVAIADAIRDADPPVTAADYCQNGILVRSGEQLVSIDPEGVWVELAPPPAGLSVGNMRITVASGAAQGESRHIYWFDGSTNRAHLSGSWVREPAPGDTYELVWSLADELQVAVNYYGAVNSQVAGARGLRLVAYEAGTHVILDNWASDPGYEDVCAFHKSVAQSPEMNAVLQSYLDAWKVIGGEEMTWFHYCGYGVDSFFGLLEYQDDGQTQKWRALRDWAQAHPRWWGE